MTLVAVTVTPPHKETETGTETETETETERDRESGARISGAADRSLPTIVRLPKTRFINIYLLFKTSIRAESRVAWWWVRNY